jgi:hypothetical protein
MGTPAKVHSGLLTMRWKDRQFRIAQVKLMKFAQGVPIPGPIGNRHSRKRMRQQVLAIGAAQPARIRHQENPPTRPVRQTQSELAISMARELNRNEALIAH